MNYYYAVPASETDLHRGVESVIETVLLFVGGWSTFAMLFFWAMKRDD
jgi:hypothetical protein